MFLQMGSLKPLAMKNNPKINFRFSELKIVILQP